MTSIGETPSAPPPPPGTSACGKSRHSPRPLGRAGVAPLRTGPFAAKSCYTAARRMGTAECRGRNELFQQLHSSYWPCSWEPVRNEARIHIRQLWMAPYRVVLKMPGRSLAVLRKSLTSSPAPQGNAPSPSRTARPVQFSVFEE